MRSSGSTSVKGALSTEARAHLATLGVDLLSFIPENAFLARVRSVPLEQLAALPMVEWIGTYRPEHKLHQTLQGRLQSKTTPASGPLAVTVLLAPRANAPEVAVARASFHKLKQESTLRSGTILTGELDSTQVDSLLRSDSVLWIEAAPQMKLFDEVSSKIVAGDGGFHTLLPRRWAWMAQA